MQTSCTDATLHEGHANILYRRIQRRCAGARAHSCAGARGHSALEDNQASERYSSRSPTARNMPRHSRIAVEVVGFVHAEAHAGVVALRT
eukprot:350075-Chlamydomonas_euryale.AAC.1